MSLKRKGVLYTGAQIPLFGLGTWQAQETQVYAAVKTALVTGYHHLDCAFIYGNEHEIGQAIAESEVQREDIFITSKLWNAFHEPQHVEPALDRSLKHLQLEYLDLYLMHWPYAQPFAGFDFQPITIEQLEAKGKPPSDANITLIDTWRAMEELVTSGKVKHIGVSNFTIKNLQIILKDCAIRPAVNQVELHPYLPQHELLAFCKENNIHVTGYAPLGSFGKPRVLEDPTLKNIAEKNNTDVAHVLLAWGQQRGCSVIPKSSSEHHIQSNYQDIELPQEDMEIIDNLPTHKRFFDVFPVFED
ncbi:hypothetical protein DSO57_1033879 [Entomophthora muscae]|uniref:Uncharacterized protein n=1 Tax=Entomophthora muscae TaxID=34485 RepID=A0ACC2REQ4_9FUNG|nr:hypothetical protein DSO57_1033879 [Entomophthora muscae]